jgi:hypothetical protein
MLVQAMAYQPLNTDLEETVCISLSLLFLTRKHCCAWPASTDESPLVDSTLCPKTESQHEGNSFLHKTVADDETLCHLYKPQLNRISMQWKHPQAPVCKEFKAQASAGKIMLTFFFDHQQTLLLNLRKQKCPLMSRDTVKQEYLCTAIKNKHPGSLTHRIILLHDNAHPYVVNTIKTKVQYVGKYWRIWHTVQISPLQLPHIWATEASIQGLLIPVRFTSETSCLGLFPPAAFGILQERHLALVTQWDTCLNAGMDCLRELNR